MLHLGFTSYLLQTNKCIISVVCTFDLKSTQFLVTSIAPQKNQLQINLFLTQTKN